MDAERRLVAIFAADVEGYSRLMGADEVETLQALTQRRTILDGLIAAHRGRIANTAGDSVLAEFGSAVDAVQCAVEAQATLAGANADLPPGRHINFRIGVHVGDVMVKGRDLFGDGVNIAARLQTLASAGGTCISGAAYDQVRKILPFAFTDLGAQQVKNIDEPVRAFAVSAKGATAIARSFNASITLAFPDKPSIAVLPFQNMSGDAEQEYFCDGLVEDIITALSRNRWLFVIARNSSFIYKGRTLDVKQISRELGVRYLLEGSVRLSTERIRVATRLIDCTTGGLIWAERYDRSLADIFDLQDEITRCVAAEIEPRLLVAEGVRSLTRSVENLGAWEMVAQALTYFWRTARADHEAAIEILTRAATRYPDYAPAHSRLAFSLNFAVHMGWLQSMEALPRAGWHASRAAKLDENDPWAHLALGYSALMSRKTDESINSFRRALDLNPSSATAHGHFGRALAFTAREQEAIAHLEEALRLSPYDPQNATWEISLAQVHYLGGRFPQAIGSARRALESRPGYQSAQRLLCASLAQVGRLDEARELLSRIREEQPELSINWIRHNVPYQTPELMERFLDGMRRAGLPEQQ